VYICVCVCVCACAFVRVYACLQLGDTMSKLADVSRRAKQLAELNSGLELESSRLRGRVSELEGKLEDALGERDAALETAQVLRKELAFSRAASSSAAASRPPVPPAAAADGRAGEERQVMRELEELKLKVMREEGLREQVMREREELRKQVMDLRGQLEDGASRRDLGGNAAEVHNLSNTATAAVKPQREGGVAGDVIPGKSEGQEGDDIVGVAVGSTQARGGVGSLEVVGGRGDVGDAERRASEAERRIGDAERRASEAEKKFGDAERRAFELASLVADLEGRMRGDQHARVVGGVRLMGDAQGCSEVMEGVDDVVGVLQGVRQGGRALLERAGAVERERDAAVKERDAAVRERDAAVKERDAAVKERDSVLIERDALMMKIEAKGVEGSDERTEKEVLRLRKEVLDLTEQVAKHRLEKDLVRAHGGGECVRELGAKEGGRDDEDVQAGGKVVVLGDELRTGDYGDIHQQVIRLRGELGDALEAKAKADKGVHDRDAAMQVPEQYARSLAT
jgi:hypothetical protein